MRDDRILYVVIPCYKEEEVLPETARRMKEKMRQLMAEGKISPASRVMFVNDGSKDRTWPIIRELHESDPLFSGVNLSRNRGHQNALLAGLMTAVNEADMIVSMDADLQDDINAMDAMLDAYPELRSMYDEHDGNTEVLYFKNATATFYSFTEKPEVIKF